jgi:Xaa-Pro aminopeptidase
MPTEDELKKRLFRLREQLVELGVDGYIQTHADEFLNEYLPDCNKRLEWLTGFSGSAGFAITTADQAVLFVDGRYLSQAKQQATDDWSVQLMSELSPDDWLKNNVQPEDKIGFDAATCAIKGYLKKQTAVHSAGGKLLSWAVNPVDQLWDDRPDCANGEFTIFPTKYAGKSASDKLSWMAEQLAKNGVDASVIIDPTLVCWLFNIRGNAIPHVPISLCHAIIHANGTAKLFAFLESINDDIRGHLPDRVTIHSFDNFYPCLNDLTGTVLIDPDHSTAIIYETVKSVTHVAMRQCPTVIHRAVKNGVELNGMRQAHVEDAKAMIKFMHWWDSRDWETANFTETDIIAKLHDFRAQSDDFVEPAFDTICGAGPNGAIIHYRADDKTARQIGADDVVLIDSGAHYHYGSTDITRMFATGDHIPDDIKTNYTDVLKGHLAVQYARFPAGTNGQQIDALARQFLWGRGLDYHHGTGHGVGCVLSVHEGPQRLAKKNSDTALCSGMILSNEPGYYVEGQYGIRIENIITVVPCDQDGWDCFDTLTCVPYTRRFIDIGRLTMTEVEQVNQYHQSVWQTMSNHLEGDAKEWLRHATRPLKAE